MLIRITPARAGKTHESDYWPWPFRDHPRSCGKDHITYLSIALRRGSPPLVRERLQSLAAFNGGCWDHPRSCGKDTGADVTWDGKKGSPPLVRERRIGLLWSFKCHRITPARAGKTCTHAYLYRLSRDHPRSCGKDQRHDFFNLCGWGSPPLVRERPFDMCYTVSTDGITPARAGKTKCVRPPPGAAQDHPRSCGKDL